MCLIGASGVQPRGRVAAPNQPVLTPGRGQEWSTRSLSIIVLSFLISGRPSAAPSLTAVGHVTIYAVVAGLAPGLHITKCSGLCSRAGSFPGCFNADRFKSKPENGTFFTPATELIAQGGCPCHYVQDAP